MYKFAVCRYDEYLISHNFGNENNDVDRVLAVFDTYDEAFVYYMNIIKHYAGSNNDFWIVWIKDDQVIQFDRMKRESFTRFRNINYEPF